VTYKSARSGPAKQRMVGWLTGIITTRPRRPSGASRCSRPPPWTAHC
jgi:hypothetical protein